MVQIIDVILPLITLVIAALLTIPIFRLIRKTNHKTALTLGWFLAVFAIAGATVANLAINYYSTPSPGILSLGLSGSSPFASAFMIDAISIYMSIIIVAIAFYCSGPQVYVISKAYLFSLRNSYPDFDILSAPFAGFVNVGSVPKV